MSSFVSVSPSSLCMSDSYSQSNVFSLISPLPLLSLVSMKMNQLCNFWHFSRPQNRCLCRVNSSNSLHYRVITILKKRREWRLFIMFFLIFQVHKLQRAEESSSNCSNVGDGNRNVQTPQHDSRQRLGLEIQNITDSAETSIRYLLSLN